MKPRDVPPGIMAEIERQGGLVAKPRRRNKYGARRTEYGGVVYASKLEARRAEELDQAYYEFRSQPSFDLAGVRYVADFAVLDSATGDAHVEDIKGIITPKFRVVMKLWLRFGPCPLRVLKDSGDGRWITTIIPGAKR
jgi:hypothetical protein